MPPNPGLDQVLVSYRTALAAAPASLTAVPQGVAIKDPPATNAKWFSLKVASGPKLEDGFGAGIPHYSAELKLEIHWNPELNEETISNTIGTDVENATATMLKLANRPSWSGGAVMEVAIAQPGRVTDTKQNDIWWIGTYRVDYRLTVDLT